jgi:hypothetical protein
MGYWDGKCFFCLFWGTLIVIVGLSAKPIYKNIKKKNEKNITNSANVNGSIDSTLSSNGGNPL